MHSFEVHSNESECRKSGRLGLEQVIRTLPDLLVQLWKYTGTQNLKRIIDMYGISPQNSSYDRQLLRLAWEM